METIDSVKNLSFEQFYNSYFNLKPVIIKGGIKDARFYKRWSLDYLKQKIGDRSVTLEHTSTGVFNDAVTEVETLKGSFDKMIDRLHSEKGEMNTYYLAQSSVKENFPELIEDLEKPGFIKESDLLIATNLWMGGTGCDSGLHYDFSDNFFLQVMGSKEMVLFAPEDSMYLYPSRKEDIHHMSEIEFYNVDHDRFPLFKKARQLRVIVEAGDSVYIPSYWWHNLITLEMSISVNYWWTTFDVPEAPRARLVPAERVRNLIKGFLGMGYDIDHVAEDGELVLLKSIKMGFNNITEALLLEGADPNLKSLKLIPGASALYLAVEFDQPDLVRLLLKFGAKDTHLRGASALDIAIEKGLTEIVPLLHGKSTVDEL